MWSRNPSHRTRCPTTIATDYAAPPSQFPAASKNPRPANRARASGRDSGWVLYLAHPASRIFSFLALLDFLSLCAINCGNDLDSSVNTNTISQHERRQIDTCDVVGHRTSDIGVVSAENRM